MNRIRSSVGKFRSLVGKLLIGGSGFSVGVGGFGLDFAGRYLANSHSTYHKMVTAADSRDARTGNLSPFREAKHKRSSGINTNHYYGPGSQFEQSSN
jgi:hypothetical protein